MDDQSTTALPASMALAWGVADRSTRGPKRALTIERIVAAGTQIAVADGLTAVSMARVAERLGVSTMALYRYVPGKDDLLELMVDAALGAPPAAVDGEEWRAGLRRWAEGVRDGYRAHPWALRVPISAPPLGPNNVRWLERALGALAGTGLPAVAKVSCVLTLSGFVRSEELLLADLVASQAAGRDPLDYAAALRTLIDPRDFPAVSAALDEGAMGDDEDVDHDFDFGVERILDGIAALIAGPAR
jgi:AcrR family transcriptional regulator